MRVAHLAVAVASFVAAQACSGNGGESRQQHASPLLQLVDSVVLAQSDSIFVGEPSGFAAPSDGTFLVSDKRNATIHQFESDGAHRRSIGRRGGGPGEWGHGPFLIFLGDDSLLLVSDGMSRIAELSYPSVVARPMKISRSRSFLAGYSRGRTFFANVDHRRKSTLEIVTAGSDSSVFGGPYPAAMARSSLVGELMSWVEIAILGGDSVAVAVQSEDDVFVGKFPNGPFDAFRVPVAHRRGSLPDLLSRVDDRDPSTVEAALYKPSYPLALWRLPASGYLVHVAADLTMVSARMTGIVFVSVVDLKNRRACPDAQLLAPTDPFPRISFRGDTLLALVQDETPAGENRTLIRKYLVDTTNCIWQPAGER